MQANFHTEPPTGRSTALYPSCSASILLNSSRPYLVRSSQATPWHRHTRPCVNFGIADGWRVAAPCARGPVALRELSLTQRAVQTASACVARRVARGVFGPEDFLR